MDFSSFFYIQDFVLFSVVPFWVCSSVGRAAVSKAAGRGFESLRTRAEIVGKCEVS